MVLRPLYCGFTMAPPCRGRSRRPLRHTPPAGRAATTTSGVRTGSGVTSFRRLQLPTAQAPARCPDNRSRPLPSPPGSGCHGNAWRGLARPGPARCGLPRAPPPPRPRTVPLQAPPVPGSPARSAREVQELPVVPLLSRPPLSAPGSEGTAGIQRRCNKKGAGTRILIVVLVLFFFFFEMVLFAET